MRQGPGQAVTAAKAASLLVALAFACATGPGRVPDPARPEGVAPAEATPAPAPAEGHAGAEG
ncbi:MAG TPA: hypothetical protein VLS93_00775, partial [Anaeromyxobacteraceae bacterium]|nr:hypothetical protein [Anaeromyxobacteraceae bacterium]